MRFLGGGSSCCCRRATTLRIGHRPQCACMYDHLRGGLLCSGTHPCGCANARLPWLARPRQAPRSATCSGRAPPWATTTSPWQRRWRTRCTAGGPGWCGGMAPFGGRGRERRNSTVQQRVQLFPGPRPPSPTLQPPSPNKPLRRLHVPLSSIACAVIIFLQCKAARPARRRPRQRAVGAGVGGRVRP